MFETAQIGPIYHKKTKRHIIYAVSFIGSIPVMGGSNGICGVMPVIYISTYTEISIKAIVLAFM